jgi:hypothetical protein
VAAGLRIEDFKELSFFATSDAEEGTFVGFWIHFKLDLVEPLLHIGLYFVVTIKALLSTSKVNNFIFAASADHNLPFLVIFLMTELAFQALNDMAHECINHGIVLLCVVLHRLGLDLHLCHLLKQILVLKD